MTIILSDKYMSCRQTSTTITTSHTCTLLNEEIIWFSHSMFHFYIFFDRVEQFDPVAQELEAYKATAQNKWRLITKFIHTMNPNTEKQHRAVNLSNLRDKRHNYKHMSQHYHKSVHKSIMRSSLGGELKLYSFIFAWGYQLYILNNQ